MSSSGAGGPASGLSLELQQYQTFSVKLKEKITELRRRKGVSPAERKDLDNQIADITSVETRLRNQLEAQTRQLDQLPRAEIAKSRIALGKLSKDFERVKATVVLMISEAGMVKVEVEADAASGGGKGGGANDTVFKMGTQSNSPAKDSKGGKGGMQFQNQLQGQEVDDLIAEERERDILKMNQDLRLVNEMFKDMAEIVEKQNPNIVQIAATTETSHDRAKAGLEQVQQAAAHQSGGCAIA